ncbi:MAG: hypothetical protein ACRYF3_15600 [Janthinobacterium lividum]
MEWKTLVVSLERLRYTADHPGAQQRHVFHTRIVLVERVAVRGAQGLVDAARCGRAVLYPDAAVRDVVSVVTSIRRGPVMVWTHRVLRDAMWDVNWGVTCSWVSTAGAAAEMPAHHRKPRPAPFCWFYSALARVTPSVG